MTAARRLKLAALPHPVPHTQDEAVAAIAEIGVHQRERTRIETEMNDELAKIREVWEKKAALHAEAIKALQQGVQIWCEANRGRLTQNGKVKYAHLASGEVKWRMTPPKVVIRGAEAVLEILRSVGLSRFIRIKEEPNKEAILNEPEAVRDIPGIIFKQQEEFIVVPFETQLESIS